MGDPRRLHLFAEYIAALIPRSAHIVDVAGGRGTLQPALRERSFSHVTSWYRRRRSPYNRHGHRYGWFRHDTQECYDAIVALHPDEGTDHAILYAGHHQIPAIICPCCVRPSARPFWEPAKYHVWCAHLDRSLERITADHPMHTQRTTRDPVHSGLAPLTLAVGEVQSRTDSSRMTVAP